MYEYRCQLCGVITEHHVKMANRYERQDCLACKGEGSAEFTIATAPAMGTEKPVGDSRVIKSERQLPKNWRNEGTTGKPGGVGTKAIFTK